MKKLRKFTIIIILVLLTSAFCGCEKAYVDKAPDFSTEDIPVEENTCGEKTETLPYEENNEVVEPPQSESPAVFPEKEKSVAVYIRSKADYLNIRSGMGTQYPSLGTLDKGDMVIYLGGEDGWYKTYYRNKLTYVSAAYCELFAMETEEENTEKIIAEGVKLLGTPYVYGAKRYHDGKGKKLSGFSIEKFDCSSLMQYIFFVGADKNLDLTTRTQIKQGIKVTEIKRGDLLFFTNASRKNNVGIERVGHVALYLGDNYILHTASDYAVIEEISPLRWSYFIQANRI